MNYQLLLLFIYILPLARSAPTNTWMAACLAILRLNQCMALYENPALPSSYIDNPVVIKSEHVGINDAYDGLSRRNRKEDHVLFAPEYKEMTRKVHRKFCHSCHRRHINQVDDALIEGYDDMTPGEKLNAIRSVFNTPSDCCGFYCESHGGDCITSQRCMHCEGGQIAENGCCKSYKASYSLFCGKVKISSSDKQGLNTKSSSSDSFHV